MKLLQLEGRYGMYGKLAKGTDPASHFIKDKLLFKITSYTLMNCYEIKDFSIEPIGLGQKTDKNCFMEGFVQSVGFFAIQH